MQWLWIQQIYFKIWPSVNVEMHLLTRIKTAGLWLARFPGGSSAQQLYVLSISVCSALWDVGSYQTLMNCILMSIFAVDVGSYPTLVNLAYYCGSCLHLSLVCNFHVHTLELSFLGTEPEHTMCFCLQTLNPWPWIDWPSNSLLQISIFM